jgi:hypothetical protein
MNQKDLKKSIDKKTRKKINRLERIASAHTSHTTTSKVERLIKCGGEPTPWYQTDTVYHHHKTPTTKASLAQSKLKEIIENDPNEDVRKYARIALNASNSSNRRNLSEKIINAILLAGLVGTVSYFGTKGVSYVAQEVARIERRDELREEYYGRLDEYRDLHRKNLEEKPKTHSFNDNYGIIRGSSKNKRYVVMLETPLNVNNIWYSLIDKKTGEKEEIFDDNLGQKLDFSVSPNGNFVACSIIDTVRKSDSTVGVYVKDKNEYFEIDHSLYKDAPLSIDNNGTVKCVSDFYKYQNGTYTPTIEKEFRSKKLRIKKIK